MAGKSGFDWVKPGSMLFLMLASCGAPAQGHCDVSARQRSETAVPTTSGEEVVRSLADPSNGDLWLLLRNSCHPEAPGRLILNSASGSTGVKLRKEVKSQVLPMIRGGDPVWVEDHSAVVDANFETTAMSSAAAGSPLLLRLRNGSRVIRALALAPHRALFLEDVGQ
jgi:hypothetical protein